MKKKILVVLIIILFSIMNVCIYKLYVKNIKMQNEIDELQRKISNKVENEIIISEEPEKIEFNVSKFNNQEKVIQKRLIMQAITVVAGSTQGIERINLEDIIKLCNKIQNSG